MYISFFLIDTVFYIEGILALLANATELSDSNSQRKYCLRIDLSSIKKGYSGMFEVQSKINDEKLVTRNRSHHFVQIYPRALHSI